MKKNISSNGDIIWECEVYLNEGSNELKFDANNDWGKSYGQSSQTSKVVTAGTIFQVADDSNGSNNIKINISHSTTYKVRFNQSKMLCVVETVN